ncbi:MAG: hypothetical protein ACREF3_01980, partial [Acetobacteraceae bacterium]
AKTVLKELVSGVGEQVALNKIDDLPAFKGMEPQPALTGHIKELYDTYIAELVDAAPHHIGSPVIADALTAHLQAVGAGTETPEAAMAAVQKVAESQATN